MKRILIAWVALFLLSSVGLAQSQKASSSSKGKAVSPGKSVASGGINPSIDPQKNQPSVVSEEFVIGREDVLQISVWREPELSTQVVVRPDGKITLPLVNEIQASGFTAKQLQDRIAERLKEFVESPVVTVMVREIRSQVVHIIGNVGKAGAYPLGSPMTMVELISRAGGFREFAKTKKIVVLRNEGGRQVRIPFNYNEFIAGKKIEQNIFLKNGDVVIVP